MADNKNPKLCPKLAYCRFATRCLKIDERIRKQLRRQGHALVSLEEFQEDEEFRTETEEQLKKMGYSELNKKNHLWKLDMEQNKVELDIFESRQECPDNV